MKQAVKKVLKQQEKLNIEANNDYHILKRDAGKLINLLIQAKNPKKVLEIGTSIGHSGVWIASALRKNAEFITIEKRKERAETAKRFFKKAGLKVKIINGDALKVMPKNKFDAVFIDAVKCKYLDYLKKVKLNKNALIIADNTLSHADLMKDFLSYANKKKAITLNIGTGLTIFTI